MSGRNGYDVTATFALVRGESVSRISVGMLFILNCSSRVTLSRNASTTAMVSTNASPCVVSATMMSSLPSLPLGGESPPLPLTAARANGCPTPASLAPMDCRSS